MDALRPGIGAESSTWVDRPERAGQVRWPDPDVSRRIARGRGTRAAAQRTFSKIEARPPVKKLFKY
jgi:hypothetical protein